MSWPWGHGESSYSETYYHGEPGNSLSNRPSKPKIKPVKTEKKPTTKTDAHIEKIELFGCKICNKKYTTKAGCNRHYSTTHASEKLDNEIKKKPANIASSALNAWSPSPRFICNHCGKELSSKASLDRHKTTHDGPPKPKAIHDKPPKPKATHDKPPKPKATHDKPPKPKATHDKPPKPKATHDRPPKLEPSHDKPPKPKARRHTKVTSTTTNINVYNHVNHPVNYEYNGHFPPNDFFNQAVNRFWN